MTDRQKMVIDYILNNQLVNALDIADGLNIPKGSVYRIIGTLSSKELGLIEHVGSNKTYAKIAFYCSRPVDRTCRFQ